MKFLNLGRGPNTWKYLEPWFQYYIVRLMVVVVGEEEAFVVVVVFFVF